jgi:hypothetical protein
MSGREASRAFLEALLGLDVHTQIVGKAPFTLLPGGV